MVIVFITVLGVTNGPFVSRKMWLKGSFVVSIYIALLTVLLKAEAIAT